MINQSIKNILYLIVLQNVLTKVLEYISVNGFLISIVLTYK